MIEEHGSATVYAAIVVTVLTALAFAAVTVAGLTRLSHEADRAADLAALAGARAVVIGEDGCGVAGEVAEANGAEVRVCEASGPVVTIEVEIRSGRHFGRSWSFVARARAAPADLR